MHACRLEPHSRARPRRRRSSRRMMMMTTNELTTLDDPSPDDGDAFRNDDAQHGASSTLPACVLASSSMRHGNGHLLAVHDRAVDVSLLTTALARSLARLLPHSSNIEQVIKRTKASRRRHRRRRRRRRHRHRRRRRSERTRTCTSAPMTTERLASPALAPHSPSRPTSFNSHALCTPLSPSKADHATNDVCS